MKIQSGPSLSTLSSLGRRAALAAFLASTLGAPALFGQSLEASADPVQANRPDVPAGQRRTGLGQLLRDADLVFEGTVVAIQHRNSDVRGEGDLSLPHTFITFQIERLYKGGVTGSDDGTLTLRFLGGPDGAGGVLRVSHAPKFELGSREILLVQNSESWGIPLVNGNERRFRLVDGRVLSESGRPLEYADGRVRVRPSDKENEDTAALQLHSLSLKSDVFRSVLDNMIRATHQREPLLAVTPLSSVAFERPFFVPTAVAKAPMVRAADLAAPVTTPESDR